MILHAAAELATDRVLEQRIGVDGEIHRVAMLHLVHTGLFNTNLRRLAAGIVTPVRHLPLGDRGQQTAQRFGACQQRTVRLAIGDFFGGAVHQPLRGVAAGGGVKLARGLGADGIGKRARRVGILVLRQAACFGAVCREADHRDRIERLCQRVPALCVSQRPLGGLGHDLHGRQQIGDRHALLGELAAADENGGIGFRHRVSSQVSLDFVARIDARSAAPCHPTTCHP